MSTELTILKICFLLALSIAALVTLWLVKSASTVITPLSNAIVTTNDLGDILYRGRHLCTTESYNQGKWLQRPISLEFKSIEGFEAYVGYNCISPFPHRCYRREGAEFERSKAIMNYSWRPDNCTTLPFQAKEFSAHLRDNPLLFIGDSITEAMFESLACLTGEDLTAVHLNSRLSGGDKTMWVGQRVHRDLYTKENAVSIAYIRSDYLVKLDDFSLIKPNEGEGYQIGIGSNFPWVHVLPRFKYIMINTGTHWHPDPKWGPDSSREELLEAYKTAMKKVMQYLKKNLSKQQRLWVRSSPDGHAKCSQYKEPSEIPVKPTGQPGEYEWDMLEKFDQVWKTIIEEENDPRFMFFDVSLFTNYRGDIHSIPDHDCLHTCIPGPVDDWNKLLYHEIARLEKISKKRII